MVVPFFGDQQFWGMMIGEAGAGAEPVPYKNLTAEKLAEGIKQCLTEEAENEAKKIAESIEAEGDGAMNAVASFHRSLVLRGKNSMRCCILEERVAVWTLKNTNLRLSALAAELLVEKKKITWKQLRLIRHNEWNDFEGPGEPLTGAGTAILGTLTGMASGVGSVPFRLARSSKKRAKHQEKKKSDLSKAKRSGNGRGTMAGKPSGSPLQEISTPNGKPNGHTTGASTSEPNGTANKGQENIPDSRAPAKTDDKATKGQDMGGHLLNGAPSPRNHLTNENEETANDNESIVSDTLPAVEDISKDVGGGLGRTAEALARAPMDLSLAVAQGFHNAPRLYGDTTVRRQVFNLFWFWQPHSD